MATQSVSNTYSWGSDYNLSVPANARDVQFVAYGARGGSGGVDSGGGGGSGGPGKYAYFQFNQNYTAKSLYVVVGGVGGNGGSGGGSGGAGGGYNLGGNGANPGNRGWSGGGGGGGGCTYVNHDGVCICCMGGGGGGGGGSWDSGRAQNGFSASQPVADGALNSSFPNQGATGSRPGGGDGGGGGGGGGGWAAGGGGYAGYDKNRSAGGGAGGTSRYRSTYLTRIDSLGGTNNDNYGNGSFTLTYTLVTPEITEFYATPNPQTSPSGLPLYSTSLIFTTVDVLVAKIYRGSTLIASSNTGDGVTYINPGGDTLQISDLPQSVVGSQSPATASYTLECTTGQSSITSNVDVTVFNDGTINNITIPDIDNLEPGPGNTITFTTPEITGIDMTVPVTCSAGLLVRSGVSFTTQTTVSNGETLDLRFDALPFNTDEDGLTNPQTFTLTIGSQSYSFTATTRAPDVNEIFDFGDLVNQVPYPAVAAGYTGPLADSKEYLKSPTTVEEIASNWEVELEAPYGVQIKTDDPNLQVNVKRITDSSFDDTAWDTPNLMDP